MSREPQHLLIDADDTLWENHAHFLTVFAAFLDMMEERGHRRERVAFCLREIERARTRAHGYGSRNYARSLVETMRSLGTPADLETERGLLDAGEWIFHHPVEVFPEVEATLEDLSRRHVLILVTKGDLEEQTAKIARSGLRGMFEEIEILPEKDVEGYRDLGTRHGLPDGTAWMVGNSPKSDINPARAAGLKTVFIPHRTIWELEVEPFDADPDMRLNRFRELLEHF